MRGFLLGHAPWRRECVSPTQTFSSLPSTHPGTQPPDLGVSLDTSLSLTPCPNHHPVPPTLSPKHQRDPPAALPPPSSHHLCAPCPAPEPPPCSSCFCQPLPTPQHTPPPATHRKSSESSQRALLNKQVSDNVTPLPKTIE